MVIKRGFDIENEAYGVSLEKETERSGYQQIYSGSLFSDCMDEDMDELPDNLGERWISQDNPWQINEDEMDAYYLNEGWSKKGNVAQKKSWGNGYQQLDTGELFSDSF